MNSHLEGLLTNGLAEAFAFVRAVGWSVLGASVRGEAGLYCLQQAATELHSSSAELSPKERAQQRDAVLGLVLASVRADVARASGPTRPSSAEQPPSSAEQPPSSGTSTASSRSAEQPPSSAATPPSSAATPPSSATTPPNTRPT